MIDKLKEASARQGFFKREQFESVCRHLSPDLQTAALVGYTFGRRMQSEILTLERRHLDLEAGTLRLDNGTTNVEGRVVCLPASLQRKLGRIIPSLFPYLRGKKRAGQPRQDFVRRGLRLAKRRAWRVGFAMIYDGPQLGTSNGPGRGTEGTSYADYGPQD